MQTLDDHLYQLVSLRARFILKIQSEQQRLMMGDKLGELLLCARLSLTEESIEDSLLCKLSQLSKRHSMLKVKLRDVGYLV